VSEPFITRDRDSSLRRRRRWYSGTWWIWASLIGATLWAIARVGPRIPFPYSWYLGDKWPYPNLELIQAYKRTSPTGYLLAEFLRLDSSPWLVAYYFLAALLASVLVAAWVWVELRGSQHRAKGFRIAVLGPLTGLLFLTIGSYDPFTALGLAIALFAWRTHSRVLFLLAGIYLGFQHFEQSIVVIVSWSLATLALQSDFPKPWSSRQNPIWLLPGAIVGKVTLSLIIAAQGVDPAEGRLHWMESTYWLKQAIVGSINFGPVLLLSFFAGAWAVVILTLMIPDTWRRRSYLLAALLIPAIFAVITLDHTRVFIMVTIPLVAISTVIVLSHPRFSRNRELMILIEALAWIMIPMTVQGTDVVYVDGFNVLDMGIMLLPQLIPL